MQSWKNVKFLLNIRFSPDLCLLLEVDLEVLLLLEI